MRHIIPFLVIFALLACGSSSDCSQDEDCAAGKVCRGGSCVKACSCLPEDPCTASARECRDISHDDSSCIPCNFNSQCDDNNDCTQDLCVDSCCQNRVYTPEEAVGCCTVMADCIAKDNPLATAANPDGDPCTINYCDSSNRCQAQMVDPLCCRRDTDCNDGNFCTVDRCIQARCHHGLPLPGCCQRDEECNDGKPCTLDICIAGTCVHPWNRQDPKCRCKTNEDCDDNNDCTTQNCYQGDCVYNPVLADHCCSSDAQCDDGLANTRDFCKLFRCVNQGQKTCISDTACDDGDPCTINTCQEGVCNTRKSPNLHCCEQNEDCLSGNPCTQGTCFNGICHWEVVDRPGCCKENSDCEDQIGCTIDICINWNCKHIPLGAFCCSPLEKDPCNDGNPCTIDRCVDGLCVWQPVSGPCCEKDLDCMDCIDPYTGKACAVDLSVNPPRCMGDSCVPNVCTTQRCTENKRCDYQQVKQCCLVDEDCMDANPCTLDTCGSNNRCSHIMQAGCCASDGMCNDGDPCTIDKCNIKPGEDTGTCYSQQKADCCRFDSQCEPKLCMDVKCNTNTGICTYSPKAGCCIHDADCDDKNSCTVDKCVNNKCMHNQVPNC